MVRLQEIRLCPDSEILCGRGITTFFGQSGTAGSILSKPGVIALDF